MLQQIAFVGTISELDINELGFAALLTITQPRDDKPDEPDVAKYELKGQNGAVEMLKATGIANDDKVFGVAYQVEHMVEGAAQWLRLDVNLIGVAGVDSPERLSAVLSGNAGRDAVMSYSPTGVAKTFFPLALNNASSNQAGELEISTVWISVNVLGSKTKGNKRAERAAAQIVSGAAVQIAAHKLSMRPFTNNTTGEGGVSIDVLANNFSVIAPPKAKAVVNGTSMEMPSPAARAAAQTAGVKRVVTPTNGDVPFAPPANGANGVPRVTINTGF